MARPREFEPLNALDQAVELFWSKGYEGTAISALVDAMGVGRASLYSTFGDKEELFIKAIRRYHARIIGPLIEPLFDRDVPGIDATHKVFRDLIDRLTDPDSPRGCLICVASVDCPHAKRELARAIGDVNADYEAGFYRALRRAQVAGAIDIERDPRQLSMLLTNAIQGMCVMARAETDARTLREIAEANLSMLS